MSLLLLVVAIMVVVIIVATVTIDVVVDVTFDVALSYDGEIKTHNTRCRTATYRAVVYAAEQII